MSHDCNDDCNNNYKIHLAPNWSISAQNIRKVGRLSEDEPVSGVLDTLVVGVIGRLAMAKGGTVHVGACWGAKPV